MVVSVIHKINQSGTISQTIPASFGKIIFTQVAEVGKLC